MEQTLLMIKPDAVERGIIGKILSMVDDRGLECVGLRLTRMCGNMAEQFYAVHKGKEFFSRLVEYMTSGPVVVVALQGENAVAPSATPDWRDQSRRGRRRHHPPSIC